MWLFGGVFDYCHALRAHRRQNDIDGRAHGDHVEINVAALQLFCTDVHHTAVEFIGSAQSSKTLEVLVNRADTEIAPTRHGYDRVRKASQKGTKQIIRSTD